MNVIDVYAWHTETLAGNKPQTTTEPQCGWFLYQYGRADGKVNGERLYLPASIYWETVVDPESGEVMSDDVLKCEIGGINCDATDMWISLAKRPITKQEYDQRMASLFQDYDTWQHRPGGGIL